MFLKTIILKDRKNYFENFLSVSHIHTASVTQIVKDFPVKSKNTLFQIFTSIGILEKNEVHFCLLSMQLNRK